MKPGPKPTPPTTKKAQGTFRPGRDAGVIEVSGGTELPSQPDWLTTAGQEVWMDDLPRVAAGRLVTERDSTIFATYCNLQGAIVMAWRCNDVPPAAHLAEARRMAEQFGIYGAKSRLTRGEAPETNPFAQNGRRPAKK